MGSDEKLFEKLKYLEDNVVASTHLVHNSLNELNRAYNAANTTLGNSINAFNQLSFNKFVENVVEEHDDKSILFGGATPEGEESMSNTSLLDDMKGENEKLAEAL